MEALVISPDFTIEDIHKIREYHYEITKDMTTQERINFYNEGGRAFLKEMEESYRKCNDINLAFLCLQSEGLNYYSISICDN